jgi:hypothetical protein
MNHVQILKRAWNILWSYKTLWVFGILLAFTTVQAANGANPRAQVNVSPETQQWQGLTTQQIQELPEGLRKAAQDLNLELSRPWPRPIPTETINTILGIVIAVICLAGLVFAGLLVVRYVSRTALIRMVDRYEGSGEKATWREGFRLGWSRSAWRLFLIDLLIFLAFFVGVVALFLVAATPLLLSIFLGGLAIIAGIVMTIGLGMLAVFIVIVAAAAVAMAREVFYRECILRGRGVLDSIRLGTATLRSNLKDVFLMWLLLLAIQIAFTIAMIPVAFVLLALGLVVGGGAGVALYLVLQGASVVTAIIAAVVTGLLLMMIVVGIPTLFLRGLRETYLSTAWTLGYREIPAPLAEGNPS